MLTKDRLVRLCKARGQLGNVDHAELSIDEVAKMAAMSRFHLIRQFKAVFGETPVQFRTKARLDWAKHLLIHGEDSVTDICMAVGFSSLGSFSALFARRFGRATYSRLYVDPACCMGERIAIFEKQRCARLGYSVLRQTSLATSMKIKLNSIFVDDQQKAMKFYTDVLGFKKSQDIPVGEFRWITVASPEGGDAELSLEPNVNPAAKAYQESLFEQGIPITAFEVDDLEAEFRKLSDLGVAFTTESTNAGGVTLAVFVDTCGNLIQIYQPASE